MYSEKIFTSKMKAYLKDIIFKFNTSNFKDFLNFSKTVFKQKEHNQDILKLYYFGKFYPILKRNEIISFTKDKELNPNFLTEIDNELLNVSNNNKISYKENKNIYFHLKNFGNYRENILNKIFENYETLDNQSFLMISKIFLLNDYKENDWEIKCMDRIQEVVNFKFQNGQRVDSLTLKLLEHFERKILVENIHSNHNNKIGNLINQIKSSISTHNEDIDTTKTQKSLEMHFAHMKLNYKVEFFRDYYRYDYYLPEENIVIEYDGPDHFYPLQTQLTENSKFKYRNIFAKFGSKIVIIPHFEYSRYDSPDLSAFFLKNLIFKNYDIFMTPLFHENFNYFKPMRKLLE